MTRILAAMILGATMILTTAAAFAESNSAMNRQPSRNLIEHPVAITQDVTVVSGGPVQSGGPWFERRLENRDPRAGR